MSKRRSKSKDSLEARSLAEESATPKMRLVIDENVPTWIADIFSDRGHETISVADLIPRSSDEVIAIFGNEMRAIVLTRNWKDFREYTSAKLPHGTRTKFRHLGVIEIKNLDPQHEERRMQEDVETIETEYARCLTLSDSRLNIAVQRHQILLRGR